MTWLMVGRIFDAISFLMTSTGLTPSFSARSLTESVGGSTTRRSPLASILTATDAGLNAERAASIAPGASGAAALRVSRLCWRKFTSSFWLIPSSRASSCAFMPERMIIRPSRCRPSWRAPLDPQLRPNLGSNRRLQRPFERSALAGDFDARGVGVKVGASAGGASAAVNDGDPTPGATDYAHHRPLAGLLAAG